MPSAFAPCRTCGKPIYVGARRCPNCRAATSWRSRLRSHVFVVMILAIIMIVATFAALYLI